MRAAIEVMVFELETTVSGSRYVFRERVPAHAYNDEPVRGMIETYLRHKFYERVWYETGIHVLDHIEGEWHTILIEAE